MFQPLIIKTVRSLGKSIYQRQLSIQLLKNGNELQTYWKGNRSILVYGPTVSHRQYHHKTEHNVISSIHDDFVVPNCTITEHIWRNLDKWADKTAVVCGITGKGYTYNQAYKMCVAFAACLRNKLGMRDGDCIAVMLPNCPEYPLATIGGLQAGCIVTPVNPIYTEEEILRQLQNSNAKVMITTAENISKVKNAINTLQKNIPIIVVDSDVNNSIPEGAIKFADFAENFAECTDCLKEVRRIGDDTAFLPYSSGTTGLPKGVELTHKSVTSNCIQIHNTKIEIVQPTTASNQDVTLCVLPFFHIYGLVVTMLSKMAHGLKLVTIPKFTPNTFLSAQEKYKASIIFMVPPIVLFLSQSKDVSNVHLDPLRTIMSGAAPLAGSDANRFLERTNGNIAFLQGYGLTETSPVCLVQERGNLDHASVGSPVSNSDVMIVGLENLKPLGANEVGELWVRGPHVMKGYYNNPEATNEILKPGGWLRTGDLAYYDDNHYFYITDRLKELIKVKGYQVAPAELEGVLRSHPELEDAAVIGIPHPKYGEVPKAFVVKKPNVSTSSENVMSFVAEKVASYKKLGELQFVDTIPKSAAGKILRRELKRIYS